MTNPPTLSEMRHVLEASEELQHADDGPTVQDIIDQMTPEQKDLQATIVGAALENTNLSGNPEIVESYLQLPVEHKSIIDFIVGNLLAEDSVLKHDDLWYSESLEHYGVKGMKWGVIRDKISSPDSLSRSSSNTAAGRASASAAVKRGNPTLKQTHLASLKSNGHRAINALSGDKTFWRRMAITTGITTAVVGATVAAPFVLPAGVLSAIGSTGVAASMMGTHTAAAYTAKEVGIWAVATTGVYGALGTAAVGTAGNVVGNTTRAVAGNALINKSYDRLAKNLQSRHSAGRQRVNNILKGATGIRDKDLLKHDDITPPTLSEMAHILESQEDVLAHYGIKGMKWGIRRSAKQLAVVRNGEGEETGKLYGTARAKAELAKLRPGSVKVIDTEDGPKITIKQKDGSLREVRLSADQEGVLRTMSKDPSEMSTRELKEATARAKALDEYNKLFNPTEDVNKALQDKVNAMKLNSEYATMYAKANPSATKRITNFINEVKGPTFSAWAMANKVTNGALNENISEMLKSMNAPAPSGQRASKGTRASQSNARKTAAEAARAAGSSKRKSDDYVYDITSMGKDDYSNPFIPQLESRRG